MLTLRRVLVGLSLAVSLLVPSVGWCAWQAENDEEVLIMIRSDEELHEKTAGVYGYVDVNTNSWITVLDFSISDQPLVAGVTVTWVPDVKLDK